MSLPPELADLEASYASVLHQVDAGTLSPDQAIDTVNRLVVFDGDGIQWTVSLDTEPPHTVFLAAHPGEPPTPADPNRFAPTPGFTTPTPAAGAGDWMTTPPTVTDNTSSPFDPTAAPGFAADPARDQWVQDVQPPAAPGAARATAAGAGGGLLDKVRAALPFGRKDSNDVRPESPLAGRGRLIAFVAVAVVVVLVARSCLGGNSEEVGTERGGPTALECPKLTAEVSGIEGRDAQLLGCLDGTDIAGDPQSGPQIAFMAVAADENGTIVFNPEKVMTRAQVAATAAALYRFAGGRPPAETTAVPLDGVDPALHDDVQLAADLKLVTAENLAAAEPATNEFAALAIARALAAANEEPVTGTSPASDTDGVSEPVLTAHGYLTDNGIIEASPAAFGFTNPLTATAWVRMAGGAAHVVKNPAAAAPAPSPGEPDEPGDLDGDTIASALTALTSGRADLAAGVVEGVDAEGNETRLRVASFAGLDAAGLQLSSSPASVDGNSATSDLKVTDGADGAVVGTAKARWVLTDGVWRLADWPELAPA